MDSPLFFCYNLLMNRNVLKYIAVIAMVLDHCAAIFLYVHPELHPLYSFMRFIGRLTAPIMCYFLVEGFIHTSSRQKYTLRLFIFSLIAQLPYTLLFNGIVFTPHLNMIYTLLLCFIMLWGLEELPNIALKIIFILSIFALSILGDWAIFAPAMVLTFYFFKNKKKIMISLYSFIAFAFGTFFMIFRIIRGYNWWGEWWQYGVFLFIPIYFAYNGNSGKKNAFNKWFFYIIYPLHLTILYLIRGAIWDFFPFKWF